MPWGAIVGGAIGALGSWLGGREQAKAADRSAEVQREMYQQTRQDLGPYRDIGPKALDPLFQTAMGAAQFDENHPVWKAIMRSGAARGKLGSGSTLQALADYYGTTYQPQRFNQLFDITRLGQNAAAQTGTLGASAASGIGNALIGAGNARAGGLVGAGNAISDSIGQYYYLKSLGG